MTTFVYPAAEELREVEQDKLPRLEAERPVFSIFPIEEVDNHILSWEQLDNYLGLQQVRGLNGEPARIKKTGGKRYMAEPGVYGEFDSIDEQELTMRRPWGLYGRPVDVSDLVMASQDKLLGRRLDRLEWIVWTLLTTGTFSVANLVGGVTHTDAYTTQSYTAGVTWATVATATPIANFRAVQLLSRGRSVSFGAGARAFMNRTTFNNMLANTNNNDLAGKRTSGLGSVLSLQDANVILAGEDLPQIVVYDEGYLDESGTFQLFIPNAKVVVVGRRAGGARVGAYRMTRNANNPNMEPGSYTKVIDRGDQHVPRQIDVHDGHNGGPVLFFPGAIVLMNV